MLEFAYWRMIISDYVVWTQLVECPSLLEAKQIVAFGNCDQPVQSVRSDQFSGDLLAIPVVRRCVASEYQIRMINRHDRIGELDI